MGRSKIHVLYINVTVLNGSEAVKRKVSKKLQNAMLPSSVKNSAAQAAGDLATPKMVAQMLGQELCRKLPTIMQEKGLVVDMSEVYREGPYVVLQMKVLRVDTKSVMQHRKNKDKDSDSASVSSSASMSSASTASTSNGNDDCGSTNWFMWWFLEAIGAGSQQHFEENFLPKQVTKQLAYSLPSLIKDRMSSKKVEAETQVLKEKHQARYFYANLQRIRETDEGKRNLNPMRKLRSSLRSNSNSNCFDDDEISLMSEGTASSVQ